MSFSARSHILSVMGTDRQTDRWGLHADTDHAEGNRNGVKSDQTYSVQLLVQTKQLCLLVKKKCPKTGMCLCVFFCSWTQTNGRRRQTAVVLASSVKPKSIKHEENHDWHCCIKSSGKSSDVWKCADPSVCNSVRILVSSNFKKLVNIWYTMKTCWVTNREDVCKCVSLKKGMYRETHRRKNSDGFL